MCVILLSGLASWRTIFIEWKNVSGSANFPLFMPDSRMPIPIWFGRVNTNQSKLASYAECLEQVKSLRTGVVLANHIYASGDPRISVAKFGVEGLLLAGSERVKMMISWTGQKKGR